jgi:hypothetical protein
MLNLLPESAFFLPGLAILRQQIVDPVSVGFAVLSKCCEPVVDTFSIRFHTEQLVLAWVVEKLRWGNLFVYSAFTGIKHNSCGLLFHTQAVTAATPDTVGAVEGVEAVCAAVWTGAFLPDRLETPLNDGVERLGPKFYDAKFRKFR